MITTAHTPVSERPAFRDMLLEAAPLAAVVPVDGPPFLFLLAPWLLLVLMRAGPFACLFALVVLVIAAATVLAAILAIVAAPYLLIRHLRGHQGPHASIRAPAAQAVAIESPRVAA